MTRTAIQEADFAAAYNDTERFPTLSSLASHLGFSSRSIRRRALELKRRRKRNTRIPSLIDRRNLACSRNVEVSISPREHARARASEVGEQIHKLITGSRYPVVNPEAVVVESAVTTRYNRSEERYIEVETTPRTWLSDTLKVAPVKRHHGLRFLFTGAQNDAKVHQGFWRNLQAYANEIDAEIVVGPWTYETQWWSENNPASRSYDESLHEHLCFGQFQIGPNFVFCGEMNTLPTAARPISDLVTYSRGRWAVFPHAKLQLKSVPSTDPHRQAHQVMTTGACTLPKVIPRKAGVKSIFHHVIGATLVEFDDEGDLFCRQINAADDGSFYDLDANVKNGRVTRGHRARALVCGDVHIRKADPFNVQATFQNANSILATLRPERVLLHDLHDNEARNHHHAGDNAYSFEMAVRKRDNVLEEVEDSASFLVFLKRKNMKVVVVESNHDLALERYVREGRYRNDGINIRYGLQLEDAYLAWREETARNLDTGRPTRTFSLLEYAVRQRAPDLKHVEWVHDGQSYTIDGIECGHHGFRGANGSKGTVNGFAQMGRKMSIGDKHSPEILDGVYCAGVMALQHGYNKGPSGWAVTHIVQYPNGKRSLITLQNGKWRANNL